MAELRGEDVVFVGLGKSVSSWYRCALPAYHLGCRWIGLSDHPPRGKIATGNTMMTEFTPDAGRVFVVQQPRGYLWRAWIKTAQREGAKVLYEVDDHLHGVERLANASGESVRMTRAMLIEYESCMEACDGIICATPWLAERYSALNRTWTCRNGIDVARFFRQRPVRRDPNIGWFGGAGHEAGIAEWEEGVTQFCNENELVFYSIGTQYDWSGMDQIVRLPFVGLEQVPDILANVDIGIAPWASTPFYDGKSDLRVLEGAAAGVAMLADLRGYRDVQPGCWLTEPESVYAWLHGLISPDEELGEPWRYLAEKARRWVEKERDASVTAGDWEVPLNAMASEL